MMFLTNEGYCHCCRSETVFRSKYSWLRDHYICEKCNSNVRSRHLHHVLDTHFPDWCELKIHESSPSHSFLQRHCQNYTASHFYSDVKLGDFVGKFQNQNLENLQFDDGKFDIVVTFDVFEHIFDPWKAASEIMRVLSNNGFHIFTAPKHKNLEISRQRAIISNGKVKHLEEPDYHSNPIGDKRSLVTWDYGSDFEFLLSKYTGYPVVTYVTRDRSLGIDGDYLEVFIQKKVVGPVPL